MTRQEHTLRPTLAANRPSNVIFFDCETRQTVVSDRVSKQYLKLGVVIHCRANHGQVLREQSRKVFHTSGELWEFVNGCVRPKTKTYLVAHNIVFDLIVSSGFHELAQWGWKLDSLYTKGTTSIFRWVRGDCKIVGVDNTNLFPGKLEKWGRILGFPKLSIDFDQATDADLVVYCERDVEIMHRLWLTWLSFLDANDCGSFKMTVGSTAFNTWRHAYLKKHVFIHADEHVLQLERDSYRGARVECLFQGRRDGEPFYYLDINNMYGYVLSRYYYPAAFVDWSDRISVSRLIRKLDQYSLIARVRVNVSENLFPYIYKGHTCYPLGVFDTTLTTPELIYALRSGWVEAVYEAAWYEQSSLFAEFINHFTALRRQYRRDDNAGFSEICKLLINSLYGKFGQQGLKIEPVGEIDYNQCWASPVVNAQTGEISRRFALAGQLYEEHKTGESYNSSPAIAAHVTAYARLYLARLVAQVPVRHVFYVDTDSLIVDEIGKGALEPLMHPTLPGKLKVEHASPWIEINAPKDYAMDDRRRMKGIRDDAVELDAGIFEQDQWVRLNGMLRTGDLDGFTVRHITKRLKRLIHSGVVTEEGWVAPFVFRSEGMVEQAALFSRTGQLVELP